VARRAVTPHNRAVSERQASGMSRAERRGEMRRAGFTLVELMIVVAIVGVLAVVAGSAYRKYMDAGRQAEVYAMMGELRSKEEAYRAEFNTYYSTGVDETDRWPVLGTTAGSEPKPKTVWPHAQWSTLGLNPGRNQLYCGYVALAGAAGALPPGQKGKDIFNNIAPTAAYWYAVAMCDNDSDGNASHNATFVTSSATSVVVGQNEHW
jgi:prepilin-type N-terminal cleavage/methylation domain-containing protein